MNITSDSPPRIRGSGVTVIDVYSAYAREGYEPAEIASAFGVAVADVHEAIAYYYRHVEDLRGYDGDIHTVEQAINEQRNEMVEG